MNEDRSQPANAATTSARLFKLGIGLFLVVSGLAVTALLFIPWRRARETHQWTETPCVIEESYSREVQSGDLANTTHRVFIRYRYDFGGTGYAGTKWRRIVYAGEEDENLSRKTPHASEAKALVEKYPAGRTTTCWVNPSSPTEAVLEHQSTASIYTLWWPMLFAVGGAGIAWSAFRTRNSQDRHGPDGHAFPQPVEGGRNRRNEGDAAGENDDES